MCLAAWFINSAGVSIFIILIYMQCSHIFHSPCGSSTFVCSHRTFHPSLLISGLASSMLSSRDLHWVVMPQICVQAGNSAVECRTLNRESQRFNPFVLFRRLDVFILSMTPQFTLLYKWVPCYRQLWKFEWIVFSLCAVIAVWLNASHRSRVLDTALHGWSVVAQW